MTSQYTINVVNDSPEEHDYVLLNELPNVNSVTNPFLSVVWSTVPNIQTPRGIGEFSITKEIFAVCGKGPAPLNPGIVIQTGQDVQMELTSGSTGGTTAAVTIESGNITITDSQTSTPPPEGSYDIDDNAFDDAPNNLFIGHGKYDEQNNVVPVAVWIPGSNDNYKVAPNLTKFYVAAAKFEKGYCVDLDFIEPRGTIDFSSVKDGQTVATITQNGDGSWSDATFTK